MLRVRHECGAALDAVYVPNANMLAFRCCSMVSSDSMHSIYKRCPSSHPHMHPPRQTTPPSLILCTNTLTRGIAGCLSTWRLAFNCLCSWQTSLQRQASSATTPNTASLHSLRSALSSAGACSAWGPHADTGTAASPVAAGHGACRALRLPAMGASRRCVINGFYRP